MHGWYILWTEAGPINQVIVGVYFPWLCTTVHKKVRYEVAVPSLKQQVLPCWVLTAVFAGHLMMEHLDGSKYESRIWHSRAYFETVS